MVYILRLQEGEQSHVVYVLTLQEVEQSQIMNEWPIVYFCSEFRFKAQSDKANESGSSSWEHIRMK